MGSMTNDTALLTNMPAPYTRPCRPIRLNLNGATAAVIRRSRRATGRPGGGGRAPHARCGAASAARRSCASDVVPCGSPTYLQAYASASPVRARHAKAGLTLERRTHHTPQRRCGVHATWRRRHACAINPCSKCFRGDPVERVFARAARALLKGGLVLREEHLVARSALAAA